MVRKALVVLSGKISGLHKAAFWLASFSFLSQILAFLRDRILAHYFGAGRELDLYYASFEVPDLLFTTIASLVSASILVPLFAKWDHSNDKTKNNNTDSIFTVFFGLLVISCLLAFIFMPYITPIFFKGFGAEALSQVSKFSRILLLSPLFLGLSNFFGSIVQYEKRFLLYSLSPLFYNLGIILGALSGANNFGVIALVLGVCAGALVHMLIQSFWVFASGNSPKLTLSINWPEVRKTFVLSVPRTISLSASGLVGLVFVAIASMFPEGSIAAYTFSFNLQSVPLVIIGASYSLAAFPTLASHYVKKEMGALAECLSGGLRHIIFWSLPVTALFIVLRAHIVRVVLGSGAFDWSDTRITAALLALFVSSITFQSVQLFLTRAHYAFGRTKIPLYINISSASLTVVLALFFSKGFDPQGSFFSFLAGILKVSGFERLVVLGLPAAFSIGAVLSALLLWFYLEKEIKKAVFPQICLSIRDSAMAAVLTGAATLVGLRLFDNVFSLESAVGVFMHGATAGVLGLIAGAAFLWIIGNREIKEIVLRLKKHE